MSFNNDDLSKAISDAAKISLDIVENAMNCLKNSNFHIQFQEQINNLVIVQQHSINSAFEKFVPLLNSSLDQAFYAAEDALKDATTTCTDIFNEVFSSMNISTFNSYMQDIYNNVPEDISINFNEAELNIAKNIQSCIKAYNTNPNTITKIKIPVNKKIIGSIFLFIVIVVALIRSDYDIEENLTSLLNNLLPIVFIEIGKFVMSDTSNK